MKEAAQVLDAAPAEVPARVTPVFGGAPPARAGTERKHLVLCHRWRCKFNGGKDCGAPRFSPRLLEGVPAPEMKSLADDIKKPLGCRSA